MRDQATHSPAQESSGRFSGLICGLVVAYLKAVGPTLRVRRLGRRGGRPDDRRAEAAVYAALHGDQIALAGTHGAGVTALASRSRDGELASRVLSALGHRAVRGSSSRGAVAGLLGLRRAVRDGASVLLTVDGPRGPRGSVAPGVAILAAASGAPLVPVVAVCHPALRLRSWDALQIPIPFARVLVLYGRPIDPSGPRAGVTTRVGLALQRLRARADALLQADGER